MPTYESKQNSGILAALSKPVIEFFWPSITGALEEMLRFSQSSSEENQIFAFIRIENIGAILLINGEEATIGALDGLVQFIETCFGSNAHAIRNGIDRIVVVIRHQDSSLFQKHVETLFREIGGYGASIDGNPICFSLKIGAALCNKNNAGYFNKALDEAFLAFYEAEHSSATNFFFYQDIAQQISLYQEELQIAAKFQSIILNKKIKLAYQPVISAKTGKVKSYEALLRFLDDKGEFSTAGYMIPVAEKYGFIDKIDLFVLHNAVKELLLNDEVCISINVSNFSVHNTAWLENAKELLVDSAVANRLIVELTETGAERNLDKICAFVEAVQLLGCSVAIDDFGAGYTSFTQLKVLNADFVKIDGAFVKDIDQNPDSKLFVKTLQEFANAFGVETIAEFVETGNIAKTLMELGVNYLQGYYFGKPINHRPWIEDDTIL